MHKKSINIKTKHKNNESTELDQWLAQNENRSLKTTEESKLKLKFLII